uniref:Uncharacterized protein n=1 Tax=Nelumbo nucifera TaxID=4432 RepID=A0A822YEI4_NELNU|nr:TPA_asm: hypothetical protein HUJ06_009758 [Nelumbo nucifera]
METDRLRHPSKWKFAIILSSFNNFINQLMRQAA